MGRRAVPKGGNGKGGGGGVAFTILGLDDASDTGISNSDDLTNLATGFTLTGTIDPSITSFTLVVDGEEFTVTSIDSSGNWSFTYPATGHALSDRPILVEECYTTVHPRNGKTQTKTAEPYSFELDTQIVAPTIDAATDDGSGGVLLTGTAEAGATVTILRDGLELGTTTADASGNWSFTDTAYPGGAVTYTATAEDAAGNVSTDSAPLAYGDAGNTPPTAVDDAAVTDEHTQVTIAVLASDSDADGDPLTVTGATNGRPRQHHGERRRHDHLHAEHGLRRCRLLHLHRLGRQWRYRLGDRHHHRVRACGGDVHALG